MTIGQVFAGHYHSLAIASNGGKIWGWGENTDSVLGSFDEDNEEGGNTNSQNKKKSKKIIFYKPMELKANKNLIRISGGVTDLYETYFHFSGKINNSISNTQKGKVKVIACGGSHTLALTTTDDVFSWGYGEEGQLGLKELKCAMMPQKVDFGADRKINKIYSGYSHSMAITKTSEIFVWGDGKLGQLGRAITSSNEPLAIDDLSGRDVIKGACGYDNCAAITNDGKLYMWGGNNSFKLGLSNGHNEYEANPRLVETLNGIKKISLGFAHSAAINSNGELYSWGHGFFGQLGHGDIITKKEPLKVDHNDLKYRKVKCGSYQTVAIDKKGQVYIWGRGGINLNMDPTKHKKLPEPVEDFKSVNIKCIQAGNGNTLVLTQNMEVYGWGDNTDGKIGGEGKTVAKSSKEIKFENESKKKVMINKIYANYSHCFAIAENGELYGWGSSKCFRLTADYGDVQEAMPKLISLFNSKAAVNQGGGGGPSPMIVDGENSSPGGKKNAIDERYILARLDDKTPVTNFKELFMLIESNDLKYSDAKLISKDEELQYAIIEGLGKIQANNSSISTEKFVHVDKLLTIRFRNMKVPTKPPQKKGVPDEILNNLTEIEKIYTLFYLHPCFFKDYFEEEITPINFPEFLQGIRPLFSDLQSFSQKSESLDNVVFLTFFKLLIECDVKIYKGDIDKLYSKLNSYSELLIESYFYNSFGRSILLDIFEKSMKDLYSICLNYAYKNTFKKKTKGGESKEEAEIIQTFKSLKSMFLNSRSLKDEKDNIKKENIEEIITIMKNFINDFESNLSKIPIYVSYCLTKIKKKMYKLLITSKDPQIIKQDKEKIKRGVLKLFYKNVLSRLLKKLVADNKDFLRLQLKMNEVDTTAQKIFDYYILIIAEFLEKISQNKIFELSEDREDSSIVYLLNTNIKEFHTRINEIFKKKLIKSNYDLKKEVMSSIIYWNTTHKVKKVKVYLKDLIDFLKVINKARSRSRSIVGLLDVNNYKVFNLFEPELYSLKSDIAYDMTVKINLYIDIRYLLDPLKFSNKYVNEIRFSTKEKDSIPARCILCNMMVPQCFILSPERRDPVLFKCFESKIKIPYLQHVGDVLRDKAFPRDNNITNLKELLDAVRDVAEKKQKDSSDSARAFRAAIEDILNKTDSSEESQFKSVLADIFNVRRNFLKIFFIMFSI
jgi:alpha-tubulin suppressor-like RCC1 family protein